MKLLLLFSLIFACEKGAGANGDLVAVVGHKCGETSPGRNSLIEGGGLDGDGLLIEG
jgi:hypothetical protein